MKFKNKLKLYFIALITYLLLFLIDYTLVNYLIDILTNSYPVHFYIILLLILVVNPLITYKVVNKFDYEKGLYVTDMGEKAFMRREVEVKSFKESE